MNKNKLTKEQYSVAIQSSTEMPFSGVYNFEKRSGVYLCICCNEKLFKSDNKYDSGTGWPAFYSPFKKISLFSKSLHVKRLSETVLSLSESLSAHVFSAYMLTSSNNF